MNPFHFMGHLEHPVVLSIHRLISMGLWRLIDRSWDILSRPQTESFVKRSRTAQFNIASAAADGEASTSASMFDLVQYSYKFEKRKE